MILTKAKLDEAQELEFSMEVFGTPEQAEEVRFVIENKDFGVTIPCIREGQNIKVTIPKLKGIFESGEYSVRMEVILDGRIFTPLKESIEFEPLVEFDVKKTKAETIKEGVRVTMKTPVVSEDKKEKKVGNNKLEEAMRKVMEEGKDVSRIQDRFVIKEGDSYCGIITKSGEIRMAGKQYTNFTEMMKTLG
jgi:hypothetical protein